MRNKHINHEIIERNIINVDLNTKDNRLAGIINVFTSPLFISITIVIILCGIIVTIVVLTKPKGRPLMGDVVATQGQQHIPQGQNHDPYNSNPPTSGPHYGDKTPGTGIKDTNIPDEILIHGLEHGGVIVSYKSDLPQSDIDTIKEAFNNTDESEKLMVPRENLDAPVAVTSWGRILKLKTIDQRTITDFINANQGYGPETAPM